MLFVFTINMFSQLSVSILDFIIPPGKVEGALIGFEADPIGMIVYP